MNFDGYFEKIQIQMRGGFFRRPFSMAEELAIGHSGLSFRTSKAVLFHIVTEFKEEDSKIIELNFSCDISE
ncbi:hypothetical protein OK016_03375 [Vibrio chagasii]|nr:hypothetical protein [Vibrio chagasii]